MPDTPYCEEEESKTQLPKLNKHIKRSNESFSYFNHYRSMSGTENKSRNFKDSRTLIK